MCDANCTYTPPTNDDQEHAEYFLGFCAEFNIEEHSHANCSNGRPRIESYFPIGSSSGVHIDFIGTCGPTANDGLGGRALHSFATLTERKDHVPVVVSLKFATGERSTFTSRRKCGYDPSKLDSPLCRDQIKADILRLPVIPSDIEPSSHCVIIEQAVHSILCTRCPKGKQRKKRSEYVSDATFREELVKGGIQSKLQEINRWINGCEADDGTDLVALDAFANARSLKSDHPIYDLEYADKLFDLDRYDLALKSYTAYFESDNSEDSYETFMRVGRSYQMLNHLEKAKKAYFRAIELNGDMYDIFQHLGECFAAQEKWGIAAYNYGRAVERVGHTPDCWLGLGLCHAATNENEEAELAFQKALAMDDRYSDATIAYAVLMVEQGDEVRALTFINDALERYEDASLVYGAVAIHLMANRRAQALTLLNTALSEYYHGHQMLIDFFPDLRDDGEIEAIFQLYRPRN